MRTGIHQGIRVSAFALGLALASQAAVAQSASDGGQEPAVGGADNEAIIVTGSRISRKDYTSPSPILTTSPEVVAQAGTATLDNYLRQLPQFQPGSGEFSNNSSGGTAGRGQSTLNLRGLGSQRNLVLMDGRRLQSSEIGGAIDINTIPSLAVGNIEVISGGASATYGSDAISGVVNFKTRTDLKGLEFSAQASITGEGDGATKQIGAAYGTRFADNRGSLLLSAEYVRRDGVASRDRPFFFTVNPSGSLPQGIFGLNSANLPSEAVVDSIFAGYGFGASTASRNNTFGFNNDGTLFLVRVPFNLGANYKGPTTLPFISTATGSGYHGSYFNFVRSPLERHALFGKAEYELSDAVTAYAQGQYARSTAQNIGSEPITGTGFVVMIPVTNPYISTDLARLLASRETPGAEFQYNGRYYQAGPRTYETGTSVWQGLAGLRGTIGSLGVNWDIYYSHGESKTTEMTVAGGVSVAAVNRLTHAADGGNSLCAGGFNPFGLTHYSPACLKYVSRTPVNRESIKQDVVEATAEGPLFKLPGGTVKYALSATYRSNSYLFVPDTDIAANDIASVASTQLTRGATNVREVAAELLLPLLSDLPLIRQLNATLGYRYSDYNLSGSAHTYKVDFDWRVARPLLLRGSFQHALRAPSIGEYFQAGSQSIQGIGLTASGGGDPCDIASGLRAGANATQVRSLCIATGVSASIIDSYKGPVTGSVVSQTVGNPFLKPETANTWTIGGVISSPFDAPALRNITLTVDYYNIEIKGAISTLNALDVLQKCYNADGSNPTYSASNFFCTQFSRETSSGQFNTLSRPNLNLGGIKTSGVDVQFNWRIPVEPISGAITLNSYVNYLSSYAVQTLANGPFQERVGTISTGTSFPRWNAVSSATVDAGPFALTGRWRHVSAMRDSSVVTNPNSPIPGTRAFDYFDISGNLAVSKNFEFRLGVNNVANRQPPIVGGGLGNTNLGVYDSIGRTFFLAIKGRI